MKECMEMYKNKLCWDETTSKNYKLEANNVRDRVLDCTTELQKAESQADVFNARHKLLNTSAFYFVSCMKSDE